MNPITHNTYSIAQHLPLRRGRREESFKALGAVVNRRRPLPVHGLPHLQRFGRQHDGLRQHVCRRHAVGLHHLLQCGARFLPAVLLETLLEARHEEGEVHVPVVDIEDRMLLFKEFLCGWRRKK